MAVRRRCYAVSTDTFAMTTSSHHAAGPTGMLAHYRVELWSHDPPPAKWTLGSLPAQDFGAPGPGGTDDVTLVERNLALEDGVPPPYWTLRSEPLSALEPHEHQEVEQALQQSWWFREARDVAGACAHRVVIVDHLHTGLDVRQRLSDLQRLVAAALDEHPADAIYWPPTQQFLAAAPVRQSFVEDDFANPLPGGLNVRLYDVPDLPGREPFKLMDTLGLGALGLQDFEIRYRGLDPDAVSQVLYHTAVYVLDQQAALREGETIQGPGTNDRWLLEQGTSLAEPAREVWDLDPGHPFAVEVESLLGDDE